jgi:peptide/nickel transport system permease protein
MLTVILRRVVMAVPALLGVSVVSFLLLNVLPGDPLAGVAGPGATQAQRDALAHQLGLDRPLPVQYWLWLSRVLHGDMGFSQQRGQPVSTLIGSALPNTVVLAAAAAVLGLAAGLLLGALAALWAGRWPDRIISGSSVVGLSIPNYWLAILMIIVFATELRWLPSGGMHGPDGGLGDMLAHLTLPAIAAAGVTAGLTARMTRASLLETGAEDFVLTLRAQGLSRRQVFWHVAKNAAPPILAVGGLQVGYLLGGSVLVETIFSWPGLGQLMYQAIADRDMLTVQGSVLVIAVTFVLVNLVVDVAQTVVNPRLRRGA